MVKKKATWSERNRRFDGRTFTYYNAYRTKKKARNAAHLLRLGVYHARVINHPGYPIRGQCTGAGSEGEIV